MKIKLHVNNNNKNNKILLKYINRTEFVSMLCFRQHNNYSFGQSDLYFICRLKPITSQIKKQEEEIEDCQWIPVCFLVISLFM